MRDVPTRARVAQNGRAGKIHVNGRAFIRNLEVLLSILFALLGCVFAPSVKTSRVRFRRVIALTRPRPPQKKTKHRPQSLNDFLDHHSEELRLELRRADSPPVSEEERGGGGVKQDKHGQEDLGETTSEREEGEQKSGYCENGEFSQRVHSIYQEFLAVVQGNLEGKGTPMLLPPYHYGQPCTIYTYLPTLVLKPR